MRKQQERMRKKQERFRIWQARLHNRSREFGSIYTSKRKFLPKPKVNNNKLTV